MNFQEKMNFDENEKKKLQLQHGLSILWIEISRLMNSRVYRISSPQEQPYDNLSQVFTFCKEVALQYNPSDGKQKLLEFTCFLVSYASFLDFNFDDVGWEGNVMTILNHRPNYTWVKAIGWEIIGRKRKRKPC